MKIFRGAVMAASVLIATSASAQNSYQPPVARIYAAAADTVLAPAATSHAATVAQFLAGRGMPVSAAALIETGGGPALSGLTAVRFEETASGLSLYGVYAKAAFNARGDLVHLIENLVPVSAVVGPAASAAQALAAAVQEHHGAAVALPPQARAQGNTVVFAKTPFFHREPTVTHVAVAGQGALQHGMLVETWSEQGNLLHETLVGPSGEVLFAELRTNYDSYYVFAIDPKQSIQTLVTGNAGWLGAAGQTTVNISGPNVHAYLDANANNAPDSGGSAVINGEFQTAWDSHQAPGVDTNRAVAVQNLFYLNNVMHDELKEHGFTPLQGNFEGNDPVNAEAQDGSGTDNANFSTPADGSSPRMQMYLWSNPAPTLAVVVNGTPYAGKNADFGPQPTTTGISGALALPSAANGCSKLKAITGKVAVIDRGTCSFKTKVANAQAAGAIGVVIANNDTGSLFVMGDDTTVRTRITIPSVFVGQDDGITLKSKAALAQTATLKDQGLTLLMADASLDSDVVYHEYGHGLTWRMIGGMSGPIAGAIGEGASDGVALLMNDGDVVGEYSAGVPEGIRRHPYSNYPLTYGDVTGAEVHDDGEVFAAIVYDLKQRFGTAKLNTLFNYYVDGMNFTPATPMFENMRDGMLESAKGSAADSCLIWQSFAKFGVGVGAKASISRRGAVTIAESFAFPASCQ